MIANDSHETPGLPSSADLDAAEGAESEFACTNCQKPYTLAELREMVPTAKFERCPTCLGDCGDAFSHKPFDCARCGTTGSVLTEESEQARKEWLEEIERLSAKPAVAAEERVREATGGAAGEDFEELKRLSAAATQGEWTWEDGPPTVYAGRNMQAHGLNLLGRLDPDWNGGNNLSFIVAAVNYVRRQIAVQTAATPETT